MKFANILILLLSVFADNIEILTDDFDYIFVGNKIIESAKLSNCNSVKISHSGLCTYKLASLNDRVYYLEDTTVYFNKPIRQKIRIDYEYKYFYMTLEAWFMVFLITSMVLYVFCVDINILNLSVDSHEFKKN